MPDENAVLSMISGEMNETQWQMLGQELGWGDVVAREAPYRWSYWYSVLFSGAPRKAPVFNFDGD